MDDERPALRRRGAYPAFLPRRARLQEGPLLPLPRHAPRRARPHLLPARGVVCGGGRREARAAASIRRHALRHGAHGGEGRRKPCHVLARHLVGLGGLVGAGRRGDRLLQARPPVRRAGRGLPGCPARAARERERARMDARARPVAQDEVRQGLHHRHVVSLRAAVPQDRVRGRGKACTASARQVPAQLRRAAGHGAELRRMVLHAVAERRPLGLRRPYARRVPRLAGGSRP